MTVLLKKSFENKWLGFYGGGVGEVKTVLCLNLPPACEIYRTKRWANNLQCYFDSETLSNTIVRYY